MFWGESDEPKAARCEVLQASLKSRKPAARRETASKCEGTRGDGDKRLNDFTRLGERDEEEMDVFGIINSLSQSDPPLSELYSPFISLTFPPADRRDECVPR